MKPIDLFKEMSKLNTSFAEDKDGNVWAWGSWYGLRPHFRANFGHWSEMVVRDKKHFEALSPWKPYVSDREPTEEEVEDNKKWAEFYLKPSSTPD